MSQRAKCRFCGEEFVVDTPEALARVADDHYTKSGPCSDALMKEIVEGHADEQKRAG